LKSLRKVKAGDDYRVVYYPEVKPWFETIMDDFGQSVRVGFLKHEFAREL